MGAGLYFEIKADSEGKFEITEIDRIVKILEDCRDVEKCLNIIHDLIEVITEEIKSGKKLESTERAIKCGIIRIMAFKSLESESEVLCDMCEAVLSYIVYGMKMRKENTVEGKRKIIMNSVIDACIKGDELVRDKGLEAVIAYGSESSENASEVLFDGMVGFLIKKLKNESTDVKEKKNILIFLNTLINSELEIEEEEEIAMVASDLEKEGRRKIKIEKDSAEKRKGWRELLESAHLLQLNIEIKNEKDEEEREMGYFDMLKANKDREIEIESEREKVKKLEGLVKDLKAKKEIKEKLGTENEKNVINKKQENIHLSKFESFTSLSSLSLIFSNNKVMKTEGNVIRYGDGFGSEFCIFDYEMKKV